MMAAFAEWRRARSTCRGALVWFLRDLAPGAGWGVIDALGTPKAAFHYLRRALQPVAVFMSDEGGNGLYAHVVNESAKPLAGSLELTCYRDGHVVMNRGSQPLDIAPRAALEMPAGAFFPGFVDTAYAYRFGALPHSIVVASLRDSNGTLCGEAFHFIGGLSRPREADLGLTGRATRRDDGTFTLTVHTQRFAQSVHVEAEGFVADEDYFHLAPGASRLVMLRPTRPDSGAIRGTLHALNALTPIRFSVTA
jgi:beta-mannosidase